MLIRETEVVLASVLDDAAMDSNAVAATDVRHVVEAFRRFAELPVEDARPPDEDGDGVLAQFGTYEFRGQREFSASLTRQLVERGGEDAPMWQLSCTLYWPTNTATENLASGHLWSFGKDIDRFFDEAVALPGWAWALGGTHAPGDVVIMLDQI
ncbi:hypothetical protein [Paractinoplanes toevensis]|uniref:Uncharacterized protein n=1 Tax=Paractinoplanes toevensis TaxID=571911 RepID=A0A919TI55_9ACTN|nr:hypothetical protein [Actinoplanes toevensis]GIM94346.1 hypothetical protein Ato02nite_061390 [Actinoplanes toevensis]